MPGFSVTLYTGPAAQHEEALDVEIGGVTHTMRLHEYDRVYAVPGLYDEVLRRLEYASPAKVAHLLATAPGVRMAEVRALDLAAGNGMSADPLVDAGIGSLVGMDLIPEAAFTTGWEAFGSGSWLVATAAEDLGDPDDGPYGAWVAGQIAAGALTDVHVEPFRHRLAMSGEPLEYSALRARKA